MLETLLVALHVLANLVWIGSIVSVGVLLSWADSSPNSAALMEAARRLYLRVATPAFVASFVFGLGRLLLSPGAYMRLHWFHGKLAAALAVIALHHVLGARTKARRPDARPDHTPPKTAGVEARGSMHSGKTSAILTGALLACASLAVAFVIFQSQLVP
ncbi:MAG: CopD family protein [Polyangiaceae bacterium]